MKFVFLFICLCLTVQAASQDSIEQYCINFFSKHILGKSDKLGNKKVYFDWVSQSKKTPFLTKSLKYNFSSNSELKKDHYYMESSEELKDEVIELQCINHKLYTKKRRKKYYVLEVYRKREVGGYNYVLLKLYSKSKGYYIYFQVNDTDEPIEYFFVDYIY